MKTILIVFVTCWILYKSGLIKKLLTACEIKDADQVAETDTTAPPSRQELQADVTYILESKGLSTDNIKYMSNRILNDIISEYLNDRSQV